MLARLLLALALTFPAAADLEKARRLLDQGRYREAAQEARTSHGQQAELLEIWALSQGLGVDEAHRRLNDFRPE